MYKLVVYMLGIGLSLTMCAHTIKNDLANISNAMQQLTQKLPGDALPNPEGIKNILKLAGISKSYREIVQEQRKIEQDRKDRVRRQKLKKEKAEKRKRYEELRIEISDASVPWLIIPTKGAYKRYYKRKTKEYLEKIGTALNEGAISEQHHTWLVKWIHTKFV